MSSEQSSGGLFQQEPYDISRQFGGMCGLFALVNVSLLAVGSAREAAFFSTVMFVAMAVSFYTLTGPTVVGWQEVDDAAE